VKLVLLSSGRSAVIPPEGWLEVPPALKNVNSFQELQMDAGARSGVENLF